MTLTTKKFLIIFISSFIGINSAQAMGSWKRVFKKLGFSTAPQNEKILGPCLLAALPYDIQNLIATYLMTETDEELIARTKVITQGEASDNNYKDVIYPCDNKTIKVITKTHFFSTKHTTTFSVIHKNTKEEQLLHTFTPHISGLPTEILFSCSPDGSKIVTSEQIFGGENKYTHNLCIHSLNTKTVQQFVNKGIQSILYQDHALAISNNGHFIAYVFRTFSETLADYVFCLDIKNISNQESAKFSTQLHVPLENIKSAAFNKQDTKIIIHDTNDNHFIFELAYDKEELKKNISLAHYFRKRGICKEWPNIPY